jgi:predicted ATPase/DNA-binding winged helix-turn-helix (wHTH) protein
MRQFESFRLDTSNECLWRNGEQIALSPRPFAVLRYLVENPGRLITHNEMLDALWPETWVQPQVLRTYVLELRKILGDDAGRPRFIQTHSKRGYSFVAPVTEWNGAQDAVSPLTSRETGACAIVGRARELDELHRAFESLARGERRVIFVSGEPGIGKTALVDAFCREAAASRRALIARGQCVEGFRGREEYYPVVEALSQLGASSLGEAASRILSRLAPAWLPAGEPNPQPAVTRPERSLGDLGGALEELSRIQPLILLFEDLHWADDSTLQLVSLLARRRAPAGLLVLATCGLRDKSTGHPLRALRHDLLMRRLGTEIVLGPLAQSALTELVGHQLEQDELPHGLAAFVHHRSEGNPLFATALVEHLIAQHFLVRTGVEGATRWEQRAPVAEMEAQVPAGLAQTVEIEIECLSAAEQRILEAASLMGIAFPAWAVAAALHEDLSAAEEACDALARRLPFIERGGEDELPNGARSAFYVFVHQVYREVLYHRQSIARRATRHIRIAHRLGEIFAGREASVAREMAIHYEAAGEWQLASAALRGAACHARQRQAHAEAADLLDRALRLAQNLSEPERAAAEGAIRFELAALSLPASASATPPEF